MILATTLLVACARVEEPRAVAFVRGGVLVDGAYEARQWTPGEVIHGVSAPLSPECAPVFHVELEDMARLAALDAPAPGAALAFSPDGAWLAIGSDAGSLRVLDAWTGKERARSKIAEGAIRRVAWSPDGGTLYVGEQSPDATVSAVDPATLTPRWSRRLADELQTSPLPPLDDVFGLYSLPGVYEILPIEGGDILVAGAHGWDPGDGRRNRSRLWRLGADGAERAAWPPDGVADAILLHPVVFGSRVMVGLSRSADGPAPDLPIGGVMALDAATLTPAWTRRFEPLKPWFNDVFIWEAATLDDRVAVAGLGDGRAYLLDPTTGAERAALAPGVPILSAGVPIAVGVGFAAVRDGIAYLLTTTTNIPWGSADPATRPPSVHPAEHTLHAVTADGTPVWSWSGPHALRGVIPSPDGAWIASAAAERATDARTDLFGAVILDRATGALAATCSTAGPAHFRAAWSTDGRLAVAEAPYNTPAGVAGAYRVTVFR